MVGCVTDHSINILLVAVSGRVEGLTKDYGEGSVRVVCTQKNTTSLQCRAEPQTRRSKAHETDTKEFTRSREDGSQVKVPHKPDDRRLTPGTKPR